MGVRPVCGKCGAVRHDDQIGAERTPEEYVARLVAVFAEVRRVLTADGSLWLNLGDGYAGYWGDKKAKEQGRPSSADTNGWTNGFNMNARPQFDNLRRSGLKAKDLIGVPWLVAFALRADGYYLRSEIIWAKPNPMPESVTDRPTKAHEQIFLLTKNARYFYDADAIAEPLAQANAQRTTSHYDTATRYGAGNGGNGGLDGLAARMRDGHHETRNRRSVWEVTTKPYAEAHFATFPPDLVKPCIRAGCPVGGIVLDPFTGSGTSGAVAIAEGRRFVGLELNPDYCDLARRRIGAAVPSLFGEEGATE